MIRSTPIITHTDPSVPFICDDGNTLVILIPAVVDLSINTVLRQANEFIAKECITQILIDCSSVKQIRASGLAVLMNLSNFARQYKIRVLMLEASREVHDRLAPRLPDAVWLQCDRAAQASTQPI